MGERNPTDGSSGVRRSFFFREPSHRWWWALVVGVSVWVVHGSLTGDHPGGQNPTLYTVRMLCSGVGALLWSEAEFLPKGRVTLAGRLRIAGYVLVVGSMGLILLEMALGSVAPGN